jgi:hypothetical protein
LFVFDLDFCSQVHSRFHALPVERHDKL